MGRAAVGWSVRELARNVGVTPNTISRIENGGDALASTMERLQTALENAGVIFIYAAEEGPGVRLRRDQAGQ